MAREQTEGNEQGERAADVLEEAIGEQGVDRVHKVGNACEWR